MKCNNCGAELNDNAKFCNSCGTPVANMNSQPQGALNQGMNNQPQGAPNPNMNFGPAAPQPNVGKKKGMSKTEKIVAIILVAVISVGLITTSVLAFALPMSEKEIVQALDYGRDNNYDDSDDYNDDEDNSDDDSDYDDDEDYDDSEYDDDEDYDDNYYEDETTCESDWDY